MRAENFFACSGNPINIFQFFSQWGLQQETGKQTLLFSRGQERLRQNADQAAELPQRMESSGASSEPRQNFLAPRGRKQVLPRYFKWRQISLLSKTDSKKLLEKDLHRRPQRPQRFDSGQNQSSTFFDSNYNPWRRQQKLLSLR